MKHSPVSFFARWTLLPVLFLASIVALPAAVRSFNLAGASLQLEEVTAEVDLYYTSMRLNRALNEWNVEVTASNRSGRPISGPLVVVVESVTGSSGLLQPDGISASQPFFDLSSQISSGFLAAGNRSSTRTLSLGYVANGTPRLTTRVYAAVAELPRPRSFTRSLNEVGQPLGGVDVEESLLATRKVKATDAAFGVVTLGSGVGEHVWKFSAPGYLPVWRRATLRSNEVTVVALSAADTSRHQHVCALAA